VEIKELQELIAEERTAEENVKKAKEEAQSILKAAREKAELIERALEADSSWESLRNARQEEMMKRKNRMEQEYEQSLTMLQRMAQRNFEKAVEHVVKTTLGEKM
jgi:vacuolar-type H+-ATPase subunit H